MTQANKIRFELGQEVEMMEFRGKHWIWMDPPRTGLVTKIDGHCLSVRCDDNGQHTRDVLEHFRPA